MFARVGEVSCDRYGGGLDPCWSARDWRFWARCASTVSADGGDLLGENSAGGKIGSTFEVREKGEPGRVAVDGGGVVEPGRGVGWLEVVRDSPGEDG